MYSSPPNEELAVAPIHVISIGAKMGTGCEHFSALPDD